MPPEMMTKWAKRRHNGVKMLDSFAFFSNNLYICSVKMLDSFAFFSNNLYICSVNKYETNNFTNNIKTK